MKIFAITLILLIAYQAFLGLAKVAPGVGRDNYEMNTISSENFRYLSKTPAVFIVGSSKTNFLDYDILGSDVSHVGYGGQGALTGLEILDNSQRLPRLILVEVGDTLQWPPDDRCIKVATEKFQLGDIFSCMQHRYQPCALLLSAFNKCLPREIPDEESRKFMIKLQQKENGMPVPESRRGDIFNRCARAKALMTILKQRGAHVVAFDPPVEADVANSPYVSQVHSLVNQRFGPADFEFLTSPAGDWHTRDGTHLMPESGKLYSLWLRKQIDRLRADNSPR